MGFSENTSAALPPVFDTDTLADLDMVFGTARLNELLAGLRAEIDKRFASPATDRGQLGADAHVLTSVSGTLGFVALSQTCAELERACLGAGDVATPLERVLAAASAAKKAVDQRG